MTSARRQRVAMFPTTALDERFHHMRLVIPMGVALTAALLLTGCSSPAAPGAAAAVNAARSASPWVASSPTATASAVPSAASSSTSNSAYAAEVDALGGKFTAVTPALAATMGAQMCSAFAKLQTPTEVKLYEGVIVKGFVVDAATAKTFLTDTASAYCPQYSAIVVQGG